MNPYNKNYIDTSLTKEVVPSDKTNRSIYTQAIEFFHSQLKNNTIASEYLKNKGYKTETLIMFRVGVVHNVAELYNELRKTYSQDTILGSGLFTAAEECIFHNNMLTFPIIENEEIMNIKAKDITSTSEERVDMFIPLQYAGNNYTLTLNWDAVYQFNEVIIVEGENDLLALWENEKESKMEERKRGVIAVLGMLKNNQIIQLKKLGEEKSFILAFDNDEPGVKYRDKFVSHFEKTKHKLSYLKYVDKDPFEAVRNKSKMVQISINRKQYLEEVKLREEAEKRAEYELNIKPKQEEILRQLNNNFMKAEISGKIAYIKLNKTSNEPVSFMSYYSLLQEYSAFKSIVEEWDKAQHTYNGVICDFSGGPIVDDKINLFFGFSTKPQEAGSSTLIHKHIKEVICDGDEKAYNLLLDYLAHMFQRPQEVTRVALVLVSPESAGKGLFVEDLIMSIIGKRYVTAIRNSNSYLNNFNSILEGKLLVYIDEAAYGGSPKEASVLKGYIGNPSVLIERKGYEGYLSPFSGRFIFSSNGLNPIKMPIDNTRYWVIRVSGVYAYGEREKTPEEIKAYMDAVRHEMSYGGKERFLWELLHRDISNYNPFYVPKTDIGNDMLRDGLDEFDSWFFDSLYDIINPKVSWRAAPSWIIGRKLISRELALLYQDYLENRGDKYDRLSCNQLTIRLKEKLRKYSEYKRCRDSKGELAWGFILSQENEDKLLRKYKDMFVPTEDIITPTPPLVSTPTSEDISIELLNEVFSE